MVRIALKRQSAVLCLLVSLATAGCGGPGNVAQVTGRVTLDDEPLEGAYVVFNPVVEGGQSSSLTDASGNYRLQYTREDYGAEIGEHRVRITTADGGNPDSDPPKPRVRERLPAKYHSNSELKATVEAGKNSIDFDLTSK